MAAPTTEFRQLNVNLATTALDTAAERKTAAAAGTLVDASGSNPLDFDLVSIAGAVAAVRSAVKHLVWHVTAWGGNTQVSNFRGWFQAGASGWGFDQGATVQKFKALTYETGPNGVAYVQNADATSYGGHATWDAFLVQANAPGSQNLFAGDGQTSFTNADDDVVGFESLLSVDPAETSGTYLGTVTAGYEYRFSQRFDYS